MSTSPTTHRPSERARRDEVIERILARTRRIAVVGLSDNPMRPSHDVARALQRRGYEIVPVNPNVEEVLGVPAVDCLTDLEEPVDLVDVFRRPEALPEVARNAAEIGAPALWNQLGLRSPEAAAIAAEAGMDYVEDRCLKIEAARRGSQPPA